jgi:hypothetical protein
VESRTEEEMSDFPEHDKLELVKNRSQTVGEFLEWLRDESGWTLCEEFTVDNFVPIHLTTEKILAKYFDIDPEKLEAEKRKMLASIRCQGDARPVDPLHEEHRKIALELREIKGWLALEQSPVLSDRGRKLVAREKVLKARLDEIHKSWGTPKEAR